MALKALSRGGKIEGKCLSPGLSPRCGLRHTPFSRGPEPPKTPGVPSRATRDSARWCGRLYEAADQKRVAQCLQAVRWPGLELFQRSEMKVGPLHVPAALRASAQERSGLARASPLRSGALRLSRAPKEEH